MLKGHLEINCQILDQFLKMHPPENAKSEDIHPELTLPSKDSPFLKCRKQHHNSDDGKACASNLLEIIANLLSQMSLTPQNLSDPSFARASLSDQVRMINPLEEKIKVDIETFKILVVDDNPVLQKTSPQLVHRSNTQIILKNISVAPGGQEAIDKFKKALDHAAYSLILMDIEMPGMDGIETTEYITEIISERNIHPIPIIAYTTLSYEDFMQKPHSQLFTAYLKNLLPKTL